MDKRRLTIIVILLAVCILGVVGFVVWQGNRHARIDEWSIGITADGFDWAEVSTGYGIEKKSYSLPEEDLKELVNLLQAVTEQNCTRKTPKDAERTGYRLALRYEGKLWLFHCLSNGMIRIVFEDPETAAYYGCRDSGLYSEHEDLYHYICHLVESEAE